jgi:hypothetical protein
MLLFKRKFLPAIRAGRKTQTIRLWQSRRLRSGQRSYIPGAGRVVIETVEPVRLAELTAADARRDGFASLAALRRALEELYPAEHSAGRQAYRVRFRLLEEPDAAQTARHEPRAPRRRRSRGKPGS